MYFKTKKSIDVLDTTSQESKIISVLDVAKIFKAEKIVKRNGQEWLKYKDENTSGYILNHPECVSISHKVKLKDISISGFNYQIIDPHQLNFKSYLTKIVNPKEPIHEGFNRFTIKRVSSDFDTKNDEESFDFDPLKISITSFTIYEDDYFYLFPLNDSNLPGYQEVLTINGKNGYVLNNLSVKTTTDKTFKFLVTFFSIVFTIIIFGWFYSKGFIALGWLYYLIGIIAATICAVIVTMIIFLLKRIGVDILKRF